MKRITALLLAVAFTLGSVGAAQADGIDIKVKGQWDFSFGWVNNKVFKDSAHGQTGVRDDDNFEARQRIRTQINFITSEYLQAVLMFEIGGIDWGRANGNMGRSSGGALDADGVNIETKRAYLDWIIPNTEVSVRMGIQGLTLPSTRLGSIVFDADVAGIVVNSPVTDWLGLTAFWIRPFDQYRNDDGVFSNVFNNDNSNFSDETDLFGLVAPLEFDGVAFTPWFMYAFIGGNSGALEYIYFGEGVNTNVEENSSSRAWWLGANLELTMFDPLTFSLDAIYGHMNRIGYTSFDDEEDEYFGFDASSRGWYIAATLDYKLDWGTPGLFGWYASGDDEDDVINKGRLGRLPVLGTDGGFTATTFGAAGYYGVGNGGDAPVILGTGTGTWGIGVQIADVSFIEDLSHTLRFAYYRGTNDSDLVKKLDGEAPFQYAADGLYLTDEDSVYEINFDHNYKIYENLEACLELGWLHLKTDKGTWGNRDRDNSDDAWKAEINFRYSF